jgi:hypothetical protein
VHHDCSEVIAALRADLAAAIAAKEEAERESADIVKAFEEGMDSMARKEGYRELEDKIVELATELEEAERVLCAARGKMESTVNVFDFAPDEFMLLPDPMGMLRYGISSSSPCAHAKEAERLREAVEWACDKRVWMHFDHMPNNKEWDYFVTELRRRAGR